VLNVGVSRKKTGVYAGDSGQVVPAQGQSGAGDVVSGVDEVFEAEEGQA